jgi:hypothetical protein
MFKCNACFTIFEKPQKVKEDRGDTANYTMFETYYVCPFCHEHDIEHIQEVDDNASGDGNHRSSK